MYAVGSEANGDEATSTNPLHDKLVAAAESTDSATKAGEGSNEVYEGPLQSADTDEAGDRGSGAAAMTGRQSTDTDEAGDRGSGAAGMMGSKTIGLFGSVALTINNVSGAGMLQFPCVFQEAGYVPVLVALAIAGTLSSYAATALCDSIALLPGNATFSKRCEYSDVFGHFLGKRWFTVTQVFFYVCLLTQNVASIVSTAQVMDSLCALCLGKSWALQLLPHPAAIQWSGADCDDGEECIPFASTDASLLVTAGYVFTLATVMPMGFFNLDDNIGVQIGSFIALLVIAVIFLFEFYFHGLTNGTIPMFGDDYSNVLGVVVFNYAFCIMLPSWLNEKRPEVPVNPVIVGSVFSCTVGYAVLGIFGGLAYGDVADNMLSTLGATDASVFSRVTACLFSWAIIGLGIPVFCIMARYNLVAGRICAPKTAMFAGVVLPWLGSWMLYQGNLAVEAIAWAGLVINGFAAFIAPICVSLVAIGVPLSACGVLRALVAPPRDPVTETYPLGAWLQFRQRNVYAMLLVVAVPAVAGGIALQTRATLEQ